MVTMMIFVDTQEFIQNMSFVSELTLTEYFIKTFQEGNCKLLNSICSIKQCHQIISLLINFCLTNNTSQFHSSTFSNSNVQCFCSLILSIIVLLFLIVIKCIFKCMFIYHLRNSLYIILISSSKQMKVFNVSIMKALVSLLAPASPAFGNAKNLFFAKEQQTQNNIPFQLKPADIVFTKTNTMIYNSSRKFLNIQYDHVAVVISKQESKAFVNQIVLHISPPIVSRLPIKSLFNKSRTPLVIRPNLDQKQQNEFLKQSLDLLGTKYSMGSIPLMFLHQIMNKLKMPQHTEFKVQNLKESRICSDAILYALCTASSAFKKQVQKYAMDSNFCKLGFMMPDDLLHPLRKMYTVVYQQSTKIEEKAIIQLTGQKLQEMYQSTKKHSETLLVLAKLMTLLSPSAEIVKQILLLKTIVFKHVKIVTLAMALCNLLGIKPSSEQYGRKVIMLTSLMTIIGSSFWAEPSREDKSITPKYSVPDGNKIQSLNLNPVLIKPKL